MNVALVTLSKEGAVLAERLKARMPDATVFLHEAIAGPDSRSFSSVVRLTADLFQQFRGLVFLAPCGVVVRAIAPNLEHKTKDPAVVVVDVAGRWAVSLLSGHEGGANELAVTVGNILSAEPIITTTTEAAKNLIVGVGCRKGASAERILTAIHAALDEITAKPDQVRYIASADIKSHEVGLIDAARIIGIPLRFISSDELRECVFDFAPSDFVKEKVDLPAVAEPAALLAGRRTRLILRKRIYDEITVAIAKESSLSLE
jgi:cobalt-precorrin 5A hydrolase